MKGPVEILESMRARFDELNRNNRESLALIREAWVVCDERIAAYVGVKPPWWRWLARKEWQLRVAEMRRETPDEGDVFVAASRIKASDRAMNVVLLGVRRP